MIRDMFYIHKIINPSCCRLLFFNLFLFVSLCSFRITWNANPHDPHKFVCVLFPFCYFPSCMPFEIQSQLCSPGKLLSLNHEHGSCTATLGPRNKKTCLYYSFTTRSQNLEECLAHSQI